jgi:hypothetical protein
MLCRHIDCIAVFLIALGLLGLSNASSIVRFPGASVRVENISTQLSGCPVSDRILSRIAYALNR